MHFVYDLHINNNNVVSYLWHVIPLRHLGNRQIGAQEGLCNLDSKAKYFYP